MSFVYRQATPADNEAILIFVGDHAMQSGLQLRFDRSPDFFALPRAHAERHETWLMLRDDQIVALGSLVVRMGYINGIAEPVVYLSDLRVAPLRGIAGRWRTYFIDRMKDVAAMTGARYGFCAVIRENKLALNSIVRHKSLGFKHMRGYATVSLLARKPLRKPSGKNQNNGSFTVRQATPPDMERLRIFLNEASSRQTLGPVFDKEEFLRRINLWPELSIDRFIVAVDAKNEIIACVAPWDYAKLKRVVIDAMPAAANYLRHAYNLLAPLHHRATIPPAPGAILADIALSHLFLQERNEAIFDALLSAAMQSVTRSKKAATISLCLFDNDPLWSVLKNYWHYAVPMDLYSLRINSSAAELRLADTDIPGFEFYLA